jgi:hypothetical protein
MADPARSREVLARHLAAEAVHDPEAAAATYNEDGWYENAALGLRFDGREMVAFQYATSWQLIEDMTAHYDWELNLGHTVVQTGRITGVVGREVLGITAAGGPVDFRFTAVISFENGAMSGEHVWFDLNDFCGQAGVDAQLVRQAANELGASLLGASQA